MNSYTVSLSRKTFWALCATVFLFAVQLHAAVAGDQHWDTQFGWPGPGGNNLAIATHQGKIYASGQYASNSVPLMVWDGAQWNIMAQFSGGSIEVLDLVFIGDTLYAAGLFTNVNGVAANGLAKWDGTSWSSIGFTGSAATVATDGTNLYVAGIISTNVSGLVLNNIGKWDGANWSAMGSGLGNATNGSAVLTILATNGAIYAAGRFTNSGTAAITNVAQWNGTSWQPLAYGPGGNVNALVMNGGLLYAGGSFGTSPASSVAQWDGTAWTLTGSGFSAAAQSLATFGNQLYASGAFTNISGVTVNDVAMWNGTAWVALGTGVSASASRLVATSSNLLVGGNFLLAGGAVANGFATWNGSAWGTIGTPGRLNGLSTTVRAIATDGTNYYLGGSFTGTGSMPVNYIVRFDGTNYYPMGTGIGPTASGTVVNSISVTNGIVYVGGYFSTAGGVTVNNTAQWNGTNWSALGSGPGGEVFTIAARPDGIYASGTYFSGTSYGQGVFSRWTGSVWTNILAFNSDDTFIQFPLSTPVGFYTFAFLGNDLYVSGAFNIAYHNSDLSVETNCTDILRFDGTYGRIVGTGLSTNATAMVVYQNTLYCGGLFTTAGGVAAKGLAAWDGSAWHAVGGGVVGNGGVNSLATDGTYLYVGGTFTNLGGTSYTRIAIWDGTSWSALGSGTSSTVAALAISGSNLYAGGSFRIAGGKASDSIARWNSQLDFDIPTLTNSLWLPTRQFQTRLYGTVGLTNKIQASTDLHTWTDVSTNTNGVYDFLDTNTPAPNARYYRAALVR